MIRKTLSAATAVAAPLMIVLVGCNETKTTTAPAKPAESATASSDAAAPPEKASTAAIQKALAELSDEDRALAEKQKTCPVSGQLLGLMGPPIKIDVKGQPVFICCGGCKDELLSKPDEYLAKLQK